MESWQNPQTLALYLLIILLLVFILIIAVVVAVSLGIKKNMEAKEQATKLKLQHQEKLLETSILIQERERRRIAADVHDELISKLTAIRMINNIEEHTKKRDELLENSIYLARRISHDLMPPLIEYSSLNDLINENILNWKNQLVFNCIFNEPEKINITSMIKLHFIRIIQEVFMNVIKHADATKVNLHLRISTSWIGLMIEDNGKGFDLKSGKNGLGLSNIELRVQYLRGRYKLKSTPGIGTRYFFLIPVQDENKED